MGRTTGLLISYVKCNVPAAEPKWATWYDDTHLPDLLRGDDAPWVVTRWELTQKPQPGMPGIGFGYVTIYEFDQPDVLAQVERLVARDLRLRKDGRIHPNHAVIDAHVFTAHGAHRDKTEPSANLKGHILTYVLCNQPDVEAEWDEWYDREHVPDMLESGAFSAMSRWERIPRNTYGAHHITLYDTYLDSIQEAVDRSAVSLAKLTAAGRKHRCHTGAMTVMLAPSGRYGGTGLHKSDL